MSQTPLSNDNRIDSILTRYQWGTTNGNSVDLSYSFPTAGSTWKSDYVNNEPFSPNSIALFNTTQQQNARDALELWSNIANVSFTEVTEPTTQGDFRFAYSTAVAGNTAAWAYVPSTTATAAAESGDIWFNPIETDLSVGGHGFSTLIHEIGHGLGLKHPFETQPNNSAVLSDLEDTYKYTVMSYTPYEGVGWVKVSDNSFSATKNTSPMLYDILVMQFLYGANTSYNTGDNVYTFSNTESELKTIWDAGGTDSFDLSNQSLDLNVNLTAGEYSSIGVVNYELVGEFIQATNKLAVENIAIAYHVDIENVIGGSGNDTLTGNTLDNRITGGDGNNTINGGNGNDTAIYTDNKSAYDIQTVNSNLQVTTLNTGSIDTLTSIEQLQFLDQLIDTTTLTELVTPEPTTPAEVDKTPIEGNSNHTNYFLLQLSDALSIAASINYTTRDGAALAGEDYIATSGTATIAAGETSTIIAVEIIGDTISESNEDFFLAITNPQGGIFPSGISEITASRTIIDDDSTLANISDIQIIGVGDGYPV